MDPVVWSYTTPNHVSLLSNTWLHMNIDYCPIQAYLLSAVPYSDAQFQSFKCGITLHTFSSDQTFTALTLLADREISVQLKTGCGPL